MQTLSTNSERMEELAPSQTASSSFFRSLLVTLWASGARSKQWTLPILAIIGYVTVLRTGFVSDDYVLLSWGSTSDINFATVLPGKADLFYRPVGTLFTWQLGWHLWGYNALPYHLLGLLFHALSALLLGLWAGNLTGRRGLGWLAGAFFAVYPLGTEAVGWLAAQWDAMAVMFGLAGLWLFTLWWRDGSNRTYLYWLALVAFLLGIFSKESLLAFLPVYALSAWVAEPTKTRREWRRLAYALVPFGLVIAINLGLRLAAWGTIGGYGTVSVGYIDSIWPGLTEYLGLLVAPVNRAVLPDWVSLATLLVVCACLFAGLALFARRWWQILALALAWILLALLPVLNLYRQSVDESDLQGNRYLYLASAGYCLGLATLVYAAITRVPTRWRPLAAAPVALALLACVGACWVYLRPWHTATVQAEEIEAELRRLVPPVEEQRSQPMIWYVQNAPDTYKGAYVLRLGMGNLRYFATQGKDGTQVESIEGLSEADLAGVGRDAFAIRFLFDPNEVRFHVRDAFGITEDITLPAGGESATATWDFRDCTQVTIGQWQVIGANMRCEPQRGLVVEATNPDPQLVGPDLDLDLRRAEARYLRLRAAIRYPEEKEGAPRIAELFWRYKDGDYNSEQLQEIPVRQDGRANVLWAILSTSRIEGPVVGIRLDPVNSKVPIEIQWIAVDLVQ
jgi:hypothetical protein